MPFFYLCGQGPLSELLLTHLILCKHQYWDTVMAWLMMVMQSTEDTQVSQDGYQECSLPSEDLLWMKKERLSGMPIWFLAGAVLEGDVFCPSLMMDFLTSPRFWLQSLAGLLHLHILKELKSDKKHSAWPKSEQQKEGREKYHCALIQFVYGMKMHWIRACCLFYTKGL